MSFGGIQTDQQGSGKANMSAGAATDGGGLMPNPMSQFEIQRYIPLNLFGIDASFTNAALYMVLSVILVGGFFLLSMRGRALVPGRMQSVAELSYEFIADMLRNAVGPKGQPFFPFIFTLFMFILALNMLGMFSLPLGHYSFTVTSHIIITFALAAVVFIGVTIIGFVKHGLGFLKLFAPSGVPIYLIWLIIPIEIISYLSRPISLSVRLFANMMVGHTLLKVLGGFVAALGVYGIGPFLLMIPFAGLEVLVAFLQAFVFAVLTCIYLNDALNLH